MIKIEFEYNSAKTIIQSIYEDKMRQVCYKFAQKVQIDLNKLYFVYSGNIVNLDLSLEQIINTVDKDRKIISIIAIDHSNEQGNNCKIISPYIICPICKEHARFEIKNYRIKIYNCKNGHVVDDILFKDFENTQTIDESLIICTKCKKNKSNTYNKEMYICNECNMNLCPLCKSNHDKNHKIINYEQKYYICNVHNKEYNSYCKTCNKDICILCKKDHKVHGIVSYDDIVPEDINKEEIKSGMHSIRNTICSKLGIIIDRLNNVLKTLQIYFKFVEKNLINFNINNINYNILQNINYNYKGREPIFDDDITQDVENLMRDNTYQEFIPSILKMYNEMNKNEIDIIYNIPNNENEIKIFGKEFVENNKDLCKIIYDNKEYNISENFNCKNIKENILKFKLKGINNINVLDSMFEGCSQLSNLSNFSNWDTTYTAYIRNVFKNCKCLELPDISNWNTSNVGYMNSLFEGCSLLKSLPDISNWNVSNVVTMKNMFKDCSSLISLPDISKWDITFALKLKDSPYTDWGMGGMFDGCSKSLKIPEKFKNID